MCSRSPPGQEVLKSAWTCCSWRCVWHIREGSGSDSSNAEAGPAGPTFDQWSGLWENVPVPSVRLILSHGSFKMECSWEPLPPPCAACVFFPFPASASPPRLVLCILRARAGDERKGPPASGLHPLLVATSRNSSHYSALSWTKIWTSILFWMVMKIGGERERGLCAADTFIGYEMVIRLDCCEFRWHRSLEMWSCSSFEHLISFPYCCA